MADNDPILIDSIVNYKTQGTGDVLGDADKIGAKIQELERGANVAIDLDLQNTSVLNDLNELDSAKLTPQIDTQETNEGKSITDKLSFLSKLAIINLAVNLTGTAKEFFDQFGRIGGFTGLIEMDSALSKIQARTGEMIPGAEKLIHDLYRDGWGESRDQIADVITQADNLKISQDNLQQAVQNALILQEVYGYDTAESLRTMDSLVKNKLAPDFDSAANIIVAGLQNGADRGGDLLDTFNEYGSTFAKMGLSGAGALALINSGLSHGIDNSDRVADAVREIGIRLGTINTDPNVQAAFRRLDSMSDVDLSKLLNAFNKGEISGDEFFNGFFKAIDDAAAKNPARAQQIANTLIGTQAEDFGVQTFAGLSTNWDSTMGTLEGRAQTAGINIKDNISSQLDELWRSIETAAGDFLSSDQINLDAKIDEIKKKVTDAINVLQSGGTLGEALEVGFQLKGVDEFLGNFQRIVGNLVIAILEFIKSLQSGEQRTQTEKTIANLAKGQLAFDLKLANEDELVGLVQTAIQRGVSTVDIGKAIQTAGTELINEGELDKARELLGLVEQISGTVQLAPGADPWGIEVIGNGVYTLAQAVKDYKDGVLSLEQIQPLIDQGKIARLDIDTGTLAQQANIAATTLRENFEKAIQEQDVTKAFDIADQLDDMELFQRANELALKMQETKDAVAGNFDDMATASEDADQRMGMAMTGNTMTEDMAAVSNAAQISLPVVGQRFDEMAVISVRAMSRTTSWSEILQGSLKGFGNVVPILQSVAASVAVIATGATNANQALQQGINLGNQKPQQFAEGGVFVAGERGRELISSDTDLAILNNRTTEAFLAGQRSVFTPLFGAQASNVVNNNQRNVTLQQTFIVQSQAQADSAAQQTADNLRGY